MRRLGTPRATGNRCSPRLHKPSWPDRATPRRAVPEPPAAPPARGASGRRSPCVLAPHGRSGPFFFGPLPFLPLVCLSVKGAPARCKVPSRPEERHPRDGGEKSRSALRRSASRPGGQTPPTSPSNPGGARVSARGPAEVRAEGSGLARPCEGRGGGAIGCLGDVGTGYPPPPPPPPLLLQPPPPAPLAPVTLTRGFTLRS